MMRIDGISFAIDGDQIDLEQDAGCGEVDRIRIHRICLTHIAEQTASFAARRPMTFSSSRLKRCAAGFATFTRRSSSCGTTTRSSTRFLNGAAALRKFGRRFA